MPASPWVFYLFHSQKWLSHHMRIWNIGLGMHLDIFWTWSKSCQYSMPPYTHKPPRWILLSGSVLSIFPLRILFLSICIKTRQHWCVIRTTLVPGLKGEDFTVGLACRFLEKEAMLAASKRTLPSSSKSISSSFSSFSSSIHISLFHPTTGDDAMTVFCTTSFSVGFNFWTQIAP